MSGVKSKYWWAICYPENMKDNWESDISDLLQVPYAYCVHDKDLDNDGDDRKTHLHLIIVFPNTTTQKHALSVFKELEKDDCSMIPNDVIKRVINIRRAYNYLIHDTDECREKNKYQYSPKERISGNMFDIGAYEQIGLEEKMQIRRELSKFLIQKQFTDYTTFYQFVIANYDTEYENIVVSYQGHFDKLCKGCFHRVQKQREYEKREFEKKAKQES